MSHKKLIFSCFYAFFYCGIIMMTIGAALPDISTAYNLPYSMSGALLSCYSLGNLSSGILFGLAAIYLGSKAAVITMTLLVCAGMTTLTLTGMPVLLFLACAVTGLGRGSLVTFSQGTMNLLTNGRGSTTGLLHSAFAAGAIIAPLMFSALRVIDWRAGLALVAVLALFAVSVFAGVKEYPTLSSRSGKSLDFLKDRGFVIISALMFLYLCCEFALNGWLVTYMNHKNMTMAYSHSMAALLWVVMLAGRLVCAWLSKRVSQKDILLVLCLGSAVCFGFMLRSEGRLLIALSVVGVGLFMSGISPIIYASSAVFTNKYPLAMGVLFTIGCTGGTLMPLVCGVVAEKFGFDGGMSAILITFVLLLMFAVVHKLRE